MLIRPEYLKKGGQVGLAAPARSVNEERILFAEEILHSWGLKTVRSPNLSGNHNQFSATIEQRLSDFQEFMDSPDIKAILCAGGGYGSIQIIDNISLRYFTKYPKWIVGFSDITIFHSALVKEGYVSIHASMPVKFDTTEESKESVLSIKNALFGDLKSYKIESYIDNIPGIAAGKLIGGNLSILTSLLGTRYELDYKGNVLFIEEVDEYLYHIERMMYSLKLSGKLQEISGLIVGSFTKVHDNEIPFGKNEKEIILDMVEEYDYPVMFDFPAGHDDLNNALYLGSEVRLEVKTDNSCLTFL